MSGGRSFDGTNIPQFITTSDIAKTVVLSKEQEEIKTSNIAIIPTPSDAVIKNNDSVRNSAILNIAESHAVQVSKVGYKTKTTTGTVNGDNFVYCS